MESSSAHVFTTFTMASPQDPAVQRSSRWLPVVRARSTHAKSSRMS